MQVEYSGNTFDFFVDRHDVLDEIRRVDAGICYAMTVDPGHVDKKAAFVYYALLFHPLCFLLSISYYSYYNGKEGMVQKLVFCIIPLRYGRDYLIIFFVFPQKVEDLLSSLGQWAGPAHLVVCRRELRRYLRSRGFY